MIHLDDQRFVGNVNRVSGPENGAQSANLRGDSGLLNARVDLGAADTLTLLDHLLEFTSCQADEFASDTTQTRLLFTATF